MDLTPHVEALQRDLAAAAAAGSEATQRVAELLAGALEPAARLTLLDALAEVAAEVTEALDSTLVEVRLQGREPRVVVTQEAPPPEPEPEPEAEPAAFSATEDAGTVRITLRLPESVKTLLDQAAAGEGLSVNTWLVRIIAGVLDGRGTPRPPRPPRPPNPSNGRRITGYTHG
jgi:hypothetical protein